MEEFKTVEYTWISLITILFILKITYFFINIKMFFYLKFPRLNIFLDSYSQSFFYHPKRIQIKKRIIWYIKFLLYEVLGKYLLDAVLFYFTIDYFQNWIHNF